MKKLILLVVAILLLLASNVFATTRYVRTDGGTDAQCTGTTNAAYPGSGTGQACGYSHPYYASGWYKYISSSSGGQAGHLSAADTLVINSGSYKMGYDSVQTFGCDPNATYDCAPRPIPSGVSIIGCSSTGCLTRASMPELWGSGRTQYVMKLASGSTNSVIKDIIITDHAGCGLLSDSFGCGGADSNELSALDGLDITGTTGTTLTNVYVHGIMRYGIIFGSVADLTINGDSLGGSKIDFNGLAGLNGDTCNNGSTCGVASGKFVKFLGNSPADMMSISWNGCVENPSAVGGTPLECNSHYGDGFGTAETNGNWTIDYLKMVHNTSDGLDLKYCVRTGCTVSVNHSYFGGNAGNQLKAAGSVTVQNTFVSGDCDFFEGKPYKAASLDSCRSAGDEIVFGLSLGAVAKFYGNTVIKMHGNVAFTVTGVNKDDYHVCTSSNTVDIKNNVFISDGKWSGFGGGTPGWVYQQEPNVNANEVDCLSGVVTQTNNVIFGMSSNPTGSGNVYTNPSLTNGSFGGDTIAAYLNSGSPARDIADESASGQSSTDANVFNRGASWDAGAFEFNSSFSGTPATCGNNVREGSEVCDGTDRATCVQSGFTSGTTTCSVDCQTFDTSGCSTNLCGNGTINGSEQCDGPILATLEGDWKLDDNAASSTVIDSQNTYAGTLKAVNSTINTSTVTTTGKLSSAFTFNGATNTRNIDLGNVLGKDKTNAFSGEAWIKTSDSTNEQLILSKLDGDGGQRGWGIDVIAGNVWVLMISSLGGFPNFDGWFVEDLQHAIADNAFHHIVVTYDGSNDRTGVKIYVDGSVPASYTYSGTAGGIAGSLLNSTSLSIGSRRGSTGSVDTSFNGTIDAVRVYNRALTSTEVTNLYNSGSGSTAIVGSGTCASLGYASPGTLTCNSDCTFNVSACGGAPSCGDGHLDAGEACDDSNTTNGDGCSSICETEVAPYEKFLTYTETDPGTYTDVHTNYINYSGIPRNANVTVVKDFGASHFGDFTHRFKITINSCSDNGAGSSARVGIWSMSSTARASFFDQEANDDGATLYLKCFSSSSSYTWELDGHNLVVSDSFADSIPTIVRYVEVARTSSTLTAKLYSDANYTTQVGHTLSVNNGATAYRYFYPISTYNSSTTGTATSGSVENYNLSYTSTPVTPTSYSVSSPGCSAKGVNFK